MFDPAFGDPPALEGAMRTPRSFDVPGGGVTAGRNRVKSRAATVASIALLSCLIAYPAGAADSRSRPGPAVERLVMTGTRTGIQSLPSRTATRAPGPRVAQGIRVHKVDDDAFTGYENAVYAQNKSTIFVAYKKFAQDPRQQEYDPAELRVARSTDGGKTWSITVVDPDAIEDAQLIDQTVSVDGDGHGTILVAYHVQSSGQFSSQQLRVAITHDDGASWDLQTLAGTNCGDYNSTLMLDADRAFVVAHCSGQNEGLYLWATPDGGASWTERHIDSASSGAIDVGLGMSDSKHRIVDYYDSGVQDLHASRYSARRDLWRDALIDGQPGVGLTGLGASLTMPTDKLAFGAYEQDSSQGTFAKVASTMDGGKTWTTVPVEQGQIIGWNTAVHTDDADNVYTSYWWAQQQNGDLVAAQAHLAISTDLGATWNVAVVPERRFVQPYLDSTVTGGGAAFVSYQTADVDGSNPVLKVAVSP
jgi:hypothetical protein